MRITYDLDEFVDKTQWVRDFEKLARLGLTDCTILGTFFPSAVGDLLDFCAKHPSYHIISMLRGGILINRYDSRGGAFCLAVGDQDPHYAFNGEHVFQDALERITEMMIDKKAG